MTLPKASIRFLVLGFLLGCKPSNTQSPISFEAIRSGEKIAVQFESRGCFHQTQFKLWFEGSSSGVVNLKADPTNRVSKDPIQLSSSDLKSLNLLLAIYRNVRKGGCTTVDTITVTKFVSGKPVAEEKFIDETCDLGSRVQISTFEHYWEMANGK